MAKICILTSAHSPFDQRIFHKQAQTLVSAGHNVTLISHHDKKETRDGVGILPIESSDSEFERTIDLFKIFNRAKSIDADVYHFHDPTLLPFGAALSFSTRAKVIYDVHEDYSEVLPVYGMTPNWSIPFINQFWPTFESKMATMFDGVIGATDYISDIFRDRGINTVQTVHNFPIISNKSNKEIAIKRESEYVLVYTGGITELRGLTSMLEVTGKLYDEGYDISLWLLGSVGLDGGEEELHQRISQEGHSEYVRYLGQVDHSEVYSYQRKADIGLVLVPKYIDGKRYHRRGLSTKMVEFMYAELPVVATATEGVKHYLPDESGIQVPSRDTEAQVGAIRELLDSKEKRETMGAAGREHVVKEMSWEAEAEKFLSFYDQLLD